MFKSEREHVRHFLQKNVQLRSFWKFNVSRAKQRQRNVQKKCAARAKLVFC